MTRRRLVRMLDVFAGAGALLSAAPRFARSQATPMVAPSEAVYADIDRLAAAGLIDTLIVGARPYSRREIERLLNEAARNVSNAGNVGRAARALAAQPWAEAVIHADLARYAARPARVVDAVSVGAAAMDSPYRRVPADSNGSVAALIDPLAAYREGRPLADGGTQSIETMHSVTLGPYVALSFNPRWTALEPRALPSSQSFALQSGAVNALFGNLSVEVGRDYAVFGQSPEGGLLLSDNAPALDMVRVTNDRPAELPWLFSHLGPTKGMLFVARLDGADQTPRGPALIGYHLAALPTPHLEIGLELIDEMGGQGAPPATLGDRVIDLVPIISVIAHHDLQFSNKMAGADVHWRDPTLAGADLYLEGDVDDFDARRLRSSLLEDGGYIGGVSFTCLLDCGKLGVRAEYHQTGIRYYTHAQFATGIEQNGDWLGDPLGPRGIGTYLTVDGDAGRWGRVGVTGAFEVRSGNLYGSTFIAPDTRDFHFVQIASHPGEKRTRALATWSPMLLHGALALHVAAGIEHVTDFAFQAGATRNNAVAETSLTLYP